MASIAVAFAIVLPLGYHIQRGHYGIPDSVLGFVGGLIVAVIAVGILFATRRIWRPSPNPGHEDQIWRLSDYSAHTGGRIRRRKGEESGQADYNERQRLRIAELAADPAKRKYALWMERGGGYWSDDQIAYNENPNLTATCVHLQPIEHAMRAAGIMTRLLTGTWDQNFAPLPKVRAHCRINEPELKHCFTLPASVRYEEKYEPERYETDNPWAQLSCVACQSAIKLVHPEWPNALTKWFPSAPVRYSRSGARPTG